MASAANVESVLSVASALRMAAVTVELPAVEDPVEDMEESVELHEEAAAVTVENMEESVELHEEAAAVTVETVETVVTVEVAEAAAKSLASTKTLSPPWDKPQRRSNEADKARKIFSFRLERILHKQI